MPAVLQPVQVDVLLQPVQPAMKEVQDTHRPPLNVKPAMQEEQLLELLQVWQLLMVELHSWHRLLEFTKYPEAHTQDEPLRVKPSVESQAVQVEVELQAVQPILVLLQVTQEEPLRV